MMESNIYDGIKHRISNKKGRRQNMSNRKQSLLESALSLFIEHGFANTTIQMILDHSGVSKGTFYKFFHSKEDCLYAILNQRIQEDILIRRELEQHHYHSDFDLLVDQIAIPMSAPEKDRVWSLYWSGFYSGEIDSANLANMQLNWLSSRLVQVFGKEYSLYANEGAILCFAILHQITNTSRSFKIAKPDWSEVVPKVLKYIEVILRTMQQRNEHLFDYHSLHFLDDARRHHISIETLLDELEEFNELVQKSDESIRLKQLAEGVLTMFRDKENFNASVIEVVLQAFYKECKSSEFHLKANRLAESCWLYLDQINKQT